MGGTVVPPRHATTHRLLPPVPIDPTERAHSPCHRGKSQTPHGLTNECAPQAPPPTVTLLSSRGLGQLVLSQRTTVRIRLGVPKQKHPRKFPRVFPLVPCAADQCSRRRSPIHASSNRPMSADIPDPRPHPPPDDDVPTVPGVGLLAEASFSASGTNLMVADNAVGSNL